MKRITKNLRQISASAAIEEPANSIRGNSKKWRKANEEVSARQFLVRGCNGSNAGEGTVWSIAEGLLLACTTENSLLHTVHLRRPIPDHCIAIYRASGRESYETYFEKEEAKQPSKNETGVPWIGDGGFWFGKLQIPFGVWKVVKRWTERTERRWWNVHHHYNFAHNRLAPI